MKKSLLFLFLTFIIWSETSCIQIIDKKDILQLDLFGAYTANELVSEFLFDSILLHDSQARYFLIRVKNNHADTLFFPTYRGFLFYPIRYSTYRKNHNDTIQLEGGITELFPPFEFVPVCKNEEKDFVCVLNLPEEGEILKLEFPYSTTNGSMDFQIYEKTFRLESGMILGPDY